MRKQMKKRARQVVKSHYGILLIVCLIAAFVGSEFQSSLDFTKQYNVESYEKTMRVSDENTTYMPTGATTGVYDSPAFQAVMSAVSGDIESGKQISQESIGEAVQNTKRKGNQLLGRSRGVFASLVNGIDSGAFLVNMVSAVRHMGMSRNAVLAISIGIAILLTCGVWFFLGNMYKVITRRMFLESRVYEKVPFQRMFIFLRVKKWTNVSVVMFMTFLFQSLWSLTIIGGVIKKYSYYMVPYIVAENPDIHWKEAITLSRRMMNGHKWECFVFNLTFLLWDILGGLTFGLSNLFYVNQYKTAAFSEYYAELRRTAKADKMEGSELLNDTYLFEKAGQSVLDEAYADILILEHEPETKIELKGIRGFLANVFGITILPRTDEKKFEENEERKAKILSMKAAVGGQAYPARLFAIPETKKSRRTVNNHYLRHYSIPSLILLFFIFAFIGWLWEVSLHLVTDGEFVNRGVMHGPWLPIYGMGGVLILTVLNKFRRNPTVEFFATVVLCGLVEYFTAYYLEVTHGGQKWWDYGGYFLNLHGRICAEGLTVFGIGGMAIVYFAAPLLDNHLRKIKYRIAVPVCILLLTLFISDQVYSQKHPNTGKGITDYKGAFIMESEKNDGYRLYHRNI